MTTKRSYEDQLSMMSDHLCSMNETLTKQREEIDTLKMTSKVSCQVLTLGTGCSLEVCGLRLVFLWYYPLTNQFISYSSYSWPIGKKTPNLVLHVSVKKKNLAKHTRGKEQALVCHCFKVGFQSVPSDGRSAPFLFLCCENGTTCKSIQ